MAGAAGTSETTPGNGLDACKDTEYFDGQACQPLTMCMASEFEAVPPAPDRDRVCQSLAQCTAEQYAAAGANGKDRSCVPLSVCGAGTYVSAAATPIANRMCAPCANGTFSSQPNSDTCKAWKTCASGETESVAPALTSDRVCSACGSGKYSLNGTCTTLTECAATEYESKAASATSDRTCKAISDCVPGNKQTAAPTKTSDRQCGPCGASSFSTTKNADSCSAWSVCTAAQYESVAPSATADRVCSGLTSCTPGQRIKTGATATTNRVCEACPSGTYSTADNSTSCQAWKTCGAGQGESTAGTATTDRVCATCSAGTFSSGGKCAACASGTFSATTGATSCAACSTCGWFPSTACSTTKDTVCTKQDTAKQEGTVSSDSPGGLVVDGSGNVWMAATTNVNDNSDVVLYKYDSTGAKVKTITLATPGSERAYGLVLDTAGNVWVGGSTNGALKAGANPNSVDMAFAARFAPDGTGTGVLQFIGGPGMFTIAAGISKDVWMTMGTFMTHIIDSAGTLTNTAPGDFSKISTFATGISDAYAITVDANGNPWVSGYTDNAQYVFKGTPSGEVLSTSAKFTEFGPPSFNAVPAVMRAVGSNIWVLGKVINTRYDNNDSSVPAGGFGGRDIYMVRVSASDAQPHEVTQFGGLGNDYANSVFLDKNNDLWVSGQAEVTFNGKTAKGGWDIFASRFTLPAAGKAVQTSETYLIGTDQQEYGGSVALDSSMRLWVSGATEGQFPGQLNAGGSDTFVVQVGK